MKRFFEFGRKKKKEQPSPGSAGPPCPAGAYELRQKDLGGLHRMAAGGDLAPERQALKKCGIAGREKAECSLPGGAGEGCRQQPHRGGLLEEPPGHSAATLCSRLAVACLCAAWRAQRAGLAAEPRKLPCVNREELKERASSCSPGTGKVDIIGNRSAMLEVMVKTCALFIGVSPFCSSGLVKAKSCTRDVGSITPPGSFQKVVPLVAAGSSAQVLLDLPAASFPGISQWGYFAAAQASAVLFYAMGDERQILLFCNQDDRVLLFGLLHVVRGALMQAVTGAWARESVQIRFYREENVTYLSGSCEGFANQPQAFGVQLLLASSLWTNLTYLFFRTALHLACANGLVDVVTSLVENKQELNLLDGANRSPLMKAVQCQQEECVAVLLQRGADVNLADADGNTTLHLAVLSPNTSVAVLLLEHNASIDAQNKEGFTPLMLAVSLHRVEMVEFLLKEGADVHTRDQCERTPLMTAASGGERHLIKVLLQYGADVSHKDTNGQTAADYAVIHGHSRWFVLLELIVFTVDFSRRHQMEFCECASLSLLGGAACQAVKVVVTCVLHVCFQGCGLLAVRLPTCLESSSIRDCGGAVETYSGRMVLENLLQDALSMPAREMSSMQGTLIAWVWQSLACAQKAQVLHPGMWLQWQLFLATALHTSVFFLRCYPEFLQKLLGVHSRALGLEEQGINSACLSRLRSGWWQGFCMRTVRRGQISVSRTLIFQLIVGGPVDMLQGRAAIQKDLDKLGKWTVSFLGVIMSPQCKRDWSFSTTDDFSQGDSIRSSEKEGSDDAWHTSEEEELDFHPKEPQKPNLVLLMKAFQQFRKNNDRNGSGTESPKSPKKSVKKRPPTHGNLNKRECGELLHHDTSDASNLEEDAENDNGDDDEDYEGEEEEEEEDLTQDEKEKEGLEDDKTQSNDILEEEQDGETKRKGEINQKLEYFGNAECEGEAQRGTGDVSGDDRKIEEELAEKAEEPVDTPVSFIGGYSERLPENISAVSPKIMNNEVSCKSVPKQAVFQNVNNLQDTRESCNRKSVTWERFPRNADSCFADCELTDWNEEVPQPVPDSCLQEKESSFGDSFGSGSNSWSAGKNPKRKSQGPNSLVLEHVDKEDTEEEQYQVVDDKVCEVLKPESDNLCLSGPEESLRAAFCSRSQEKSPEREEEEPKREKEDTVEELQTAVVEGVKNCVCKDSHHIHNAGERNELVNTDPNSFSIAIKAHPSERWQWRKAAFVSFHSFLKNRNCSVGFQTMLYDVKCSELSRGLGAGGGGAICIVCLQRVAWCAVAAVVHRHLPLARRQEEVVVSRRYHDVTLGVKIPWNNAHFLGLTDGAQQSEIQTLGVSLLTSVVGAPPAEGAEEEEDTESPWDSEVLSVKDMEVSTRDVGRSVLQPFGESCSAEVLATHAGRVCPCSPLSVDTGLGNISTKLNVRYKLSAGVGSPQTCSYWFTARILRSGSTHSRCDCPVYRVSVCPFQEPYQGFLFLLHGGEGEYSSSAEKEETSDGVGNYGVQVCKRKYFDLRSELVNGVIHEEEGQIKYLKLDDLPDAFPASAKGGVFAEGEKGLAKETRSRSWMVLAHWDSKAAGPVLKGPRAKEAAQLDEFATEMTQINCDFLFLGNHSVCTCLLKDKCILETTNFIEKAACEKQTDKAEMSHRKTLAAKEESCSADKQLNPKPWEERYERMWVENEKRELKTNFKSITAELKQLFGEINETGKTISLVEEVSEDGFREELESSHVVSSRATESSTKLESTGEFGDTKLQLCGKEPRMETVIQSLCALPDQKSLNANLKDTWSRDEEDSTNDADNTKVPLGKGEGKKVPSMEVENDENGSSRNVGGSPEYSLKHGLKPSLLDDVSNTLPKIRSISTCDENVLFVTEGKLGKGSGVDGDDVPRDCLRDSNKIGEQKLNLGEELKQDVERFKSKVGLLQMVFLALEKEKNENIIEENVSSEEKSESIKMPMKGEFSLNAEVAKKGKRQTSEQKAEQQMSSSSGNHFQVLDDSTVSETSPDEGRPAAKRKSEKNKVSAQMEVTDDLDLTLSSDTTSEDVEFRTSTYREAMLLLEQLSVGHTGSAIMLEIQNVFLEYEQRLAREKKRCTAVWREVRRLESEKEESPLIAEETQDLKSMLAHQEVEWKSDIQSLKSTLKEEEEKRLRVERLYEKTREKLRRKEEQYCKETEEKRQLELHSRNLEMEVLALSKLLNQIEEESDETQRQLSREKRARALQEGILNSHLWRQKELEEETRTIEKNSEESDTEREKAMLFKNQLLQDEIAVLRLELDQVRRKHQEEEGKLLEENEALKEKNEDLKKELNLNEEALTQTALQYDGQLNFLRTQSAVLTSKLEQTKEGKDRLEVEIGSFRSRLSSALQELEGLQSSKSDVEQTLQRERDEWLRLQDKLHRDLSDVRETDKSLALQLSKAENKANSLQNELHQLEQVLREKTLLLEMTQKELSQARCQAKECDRARHLEKDQVSQFLIKQESMQERLAQLQSENLVLRQQLEDMQKEGIIKEEVVNNVQDRLNDIFHKLRADTEKQVYLVEERNKELDANCADLREQVLKYETDKVEREGMVRQLQQELADALKKQSMSEASLEVTARYRSDLEEDKLRLQKELEKVKTELEKQSVLALTSKDLHSMWEEQLKSRAHLEERIAQLHREKADLLEQCEKERKQVKELEEMKRPVELRLDQEMQRNVELQKDWKRLKRLLNRAMKKLRVYEEKEMASQLDLQGEMKNRYSERISEVDGLKTKVCELSQQLEIESRKSMQLETENGDLREELFTLRADHEKLEKSKCQLKEEVADLKHRLETNVVDHSQIEQYKRELEERAAQEITQKLQEVNLFLQTQAASQDRLEEIRASHHASLRNQLKQRIRDLECELHRVTNTQQDSFFQKESVQAEAERFKELYLEEVKLRRCLANKLERATERVAEANAKLLEERHRSESLIMSSVVSGGLAASPVPYPPELGHLGSSLALNRSLSLGGSFLRPAGDTSSSRSRVEAYVAKVRRELDEKITKELERATAELETGSAGVSPIVSTDGSSGNLRVDQDPLGRAVQEYCDVLTKNYLI
ncbi:uncharacterized protein O9250_004125 [Rhynochetos jubatus]